MTIRLAGTLLLATLMLAPVLAHGACDDVPPDTTNPYGLIGADQTSDGGKGYAAGFRWARVFVHWKDVQKTGPDDYDWGIRGYIQNLHDQGYAIMVVFNQVPPWAYTSGPGHETPPEPRTCDHPQPLDDTLNNPPYNSGLFFNFTVRAALVLGDLVAAWEPWNEPDICRHFRGTKQQWRDLILKPGYDGIIAARSGAIIGGPALAGADSKADFKDWLEEGGHLVRPLKFVSSHGFGNADNMERQIDRGKNYLEDLPSYVDPGTGSLFYPYRGFWLTAFGVHDTESVDCPGPAVANPGAVYGHVLDYCRARSAYCKKAFLFTLGDPYFFAHHECPSLSLLKSDLTPRPRYYDVQAYITANPSP